MIQVANRKGILQVAQLVHAGPMRKKRITILFEFFCDNLQNCQEAALVL